jgi:hypothetical protein
VISELKYQVALAIYDRITGGNRIRASRSKPFRINRAALHCAVNDYQGRRAYRKAIGG